LRRRFLLYETLRQRARQRPGREASKNLSVFIGGVTVPMNSCSDPNVLLNGYDLWSELNHGLLDKAGFSIAPAY
jgi:hypothetical protein